MAAGKSFIQSDITGKILGEFNRLYERKTRYVGYVNNSDELTPRELEVLELIAQGLSNKEIAQTLLSVKKTVKNHITNIFRKLNVEDRTQAALYAVKHRIVNIFKLKYFF